MLKSMLSLALFTAISLNTLGNSGEVEDPLPNLVEGQLTEIITPPPTDLLTLLNESKDVDDTSLLVLDVNSEVDYEELAKEEEAKKEPPVVEEQVVEEPVEEVTPTNTMPMRFSFYTANCKGCTGLTRWGEHNVKNTIHIDGMRVIATDPSTIPPYSIVEFTLEGSKQRAIALDIGGAIKGDRIDLLVGSTQEAYRLGRQTLDVEIIRYGQ